MEEEGGGGFQEVLIKDFKIRTRPSLPKPLLDLMDGPTRPAWDPYGQEALRSVVSQCHWTQERLHRHGYVDSFASRGAAPGTLS